MITTVELAELGLIEKEAELYLACLELGPCRAKDIASYTKLNRGTVYDIARNLFKKGLLSTTQKGGITHFVAHTPQRHIANLQQELIQAQQLLPSIAQMIQVASYRPTLRFFEGSEGIRHVYEETLRCRSKEIVAFVSLSEVLEVVGLDFIQHYERTRLRRHIKLRALHDVRGVQPNNPAHLLSETDPEHLREVRSCPASVDVAGMLMVYDNTVALMSTKRENFASVLQSHEYAVMLRQLFEVVWGISEMV